MIDIHCHILPDIDDGSENLEESLEMVRMAVLSGVTDIIATPHFTGERKNLPRLEEVMEQFELLRDAIREENLPVTLHPGVEILSRGQTPELARRGQLPTLGNTPYVLMEFPFTEPFSYITEILQGVALWGYRPVVAHPERYAAIQRDPRLLEHWFRRGYAIQLNKGSILGTLGEGAKQTAFWILDRGLAHMVASDAHGTKHRNPDMMPLKELLDSMYLEEFVDLLLDENPRLLLEGQPMTPAI